MAQQVCRSYRTIKDWLLHISHFHILAPTGEMHTTPTINAASHDLTPGLHILESLLAIDRPGIIQISLAWSSAYNACDPEAHFGHCEAIKLMREAHTTRQHLIPPRTSHHHAGRLLKSM